MTFERIILVISLVLNLLLVSLAIAIWPDRLLPAEVFFYRPSPDRQSEKSLLASQSSLLANVSESLFLDPQVESFRPIRNWSISLPQVEAQSAAAYLLDNRKMLYSQNSDLVLPIASLTKVMTATIALEQLPQDKEITISKSFIDWEKKSQFIIGEKITLGSLLYMMLIASNNEAAKALAYNLDVDDSWHHFIDLMNQKAELLTMSQTSFVDPAGLEPGNTSTANDLLKLVEYTQAKHPLIWQILSLDKADVTSVDKKISHHLQSTNQLWGIVDSLIAGKTGYTEEARGCLLVITQAPNNSGKMLNIILGSSDRFGQMQRLIYNLEKAYLW